MAVAALIGRLRGLSLPTSDPICALALSRGRKTSQSSFQVQALTI